MDMTQKEIIEIIEQFAPLAIASSWDHSGVQIASLREHCHHIAVSLDPTLEVLHQAKEIGADFFLTHHPLSMAPRFLDTLDAYTDFVRFAYTHDIPVYAAHTSLDANPMGPVAWLANALGLSACTVLEPAVPHIIDNTLVECGLGLVGDLPKPLSFESLRETLYAHLPSNVPTSITHTPSEMITRLAICPGSGSSLMHAAAKARADILITGDVKYHAALEAPLPLIDLGHFILEERMMEYFADMLSQAMPHLQVSFIPAKNPLQTF